MATARVMHRGQFGPRPAVETENSRGVAAEVVTAGHVNVIVHDRGGGMIEPALQALPSNTHTVCRLLPAASKPPIT
jgi:hypothetical protein